MSSHSLTTLLAHHLRAMTDQAPSAFDHLMGVGATAELEAKVAKHYRADYALSVANGTLGLLVLGIALEIQGAAIATTPLTFGGSIAGFLHLRNQIVFVDVDNTKTLSPKALEKVLSEHAQPSIGAFLAVDLCGNPSDSRGLRRVADRYRVRYIADCAQSFGAIRSGRAASSYADAMVISLGNRKTLAAGEGGVIVTNDRTLYEKLLTVTQHPLRQKRELGLNLVTEFGLNARLSPLSAICANALFEDSLRVLTEKQLRYLEVTSILNASGLTTVIKPLPQNAISAYFCLPFELRSGVNIQQVTDLLVSNGIAADIGPFPAHLIYHNPVFQKTYHNQYLIPQPCPNAERAAQCLALTLL